MLCQPLQLTPEYRDYVWGGDRLRPGIVPTSEAWVVYEEDCIASGPLRGRTLGEIASEQGASLLGQRAIQQTGCRFPLLIKLLDCAEWLSLQVHPNDEQASAIEGPGFFGKTEAWHILEAAPDAQIIAGVKAGITADTLAASIRNKTILDVAQRLAVKAGDTIYMPPGTIHALGPGLLLYEVQQTSDLTYRVYDWGRPETEKRKLHIEKSLQVALPQAATPIGLLPPLVDGERRVLCRSRYFTLEILSAQTQPVTLDTQGESFHALTVIEGSAEIQTDGQVWPLSRFETVVVPADCGSYAIHPAPSFRVLKSSV